MKANSNNKTKVFSFETGDGSFQNTNKASLVMLSCRLGLFYRTSVSINSTVSSGNPTSTDRHFMLFTCNSLVAGSLALTMTYSNYHFAVCRQLLLYVIFVTIGIHFSRFPFFSNDFFVIIIIIIIMAMIVIVVVTLMYRRFNFLKLPPTNNHHRHHHAHQHYHQQTSKQTNNPVESKKNRMNKINHFVTRFALLRL